MEKNHKRINYFYIFLLCLIPYYLILIYRSFAYIIMYFLGEFNVIIFTYFKSTNLFILIMAMIMIVMFILPIFFIRKMKKIVALLILTTVLAAFFKVPIYFFDRVNEIYNKYSYEEWNECPVVRRIMYKSLIKDNLVIGKNIFEAEKLLGRADNRTANTLEYKSYPGKVIIVLENDVVVDVAYKHPIG